ncbi:MAG TPA: tyrosine-type recombinase/integrase [Bellilinea sp.]|nr:tyrosine-type recombinase/integrase [Bellilinea sp.]
MAKPQTRAGDYSVKYDQDSDFLIWIEAFLMDRKAQRVATGTIKFYKNQLKRLVEYCDSQAITQITQFDGNALRGFILWLDERGNNPGGQHAAYRTVRTFLRWWADETLPEGWRDPTRRVKPPRVGTQPLDPVSLQDVKALIDACSKDTWFGDRDRAIFYTLIDTGIRANELLSTDLQDYNPITGEMLIRQGKGRKPRTVYLEHKARQAVRVYLRSREGNHPALWLKQFGGRLQYSGLRQMVRRRSMDAGIPEPPIHAFRRAFALTMLRNGVDVFTIQRLMGHADLSVLRRYLAQTGEDLKAAHHKASPAEML